MITSLNGQFHSLSTLTIELRSGSYNTGVGVDRKPEKMDGEVSQGGSLMLLLPLALNSTSQTILLTKEWDKSDNTCC